MEQTSQADGIKVKGATSPLEAQVREAFGRVVYTHKTHEKMADIYLEKLKCLKLTEIWLSALTSGSLLFAVFGENHNGTIVGAILSTVLLGLTLYSKEWNLGELAQKHADTGTKLWAVREAYFSLITDIATGSNIEELRQRRENLDKELASIYAGCPRTNDEAYKRAQKALKTEEELTFADSEIDKFLPESLRRG